MEIKKNWVDSSSYAGLEKFTGDLLVIESEKDMLIPPEVVRKYYDVATETRNKKYYIQKEAGHSFHDDSKGLKLFHEIAVDWFLETL